MPGHYIERRRGLAEDEMVLINSESIRLFSAESLLQDANRILVDLTRFRRLKFSSFFFLSLSLSFSSDTVDGVGPSRKR